MKIPFNIDLTDKVVVVTGAGGVLCSYFAKAVAKTGAKVAVLDLNLEAANKVALEIVNDGGIAMGVCCNVLDVQSIEDARALINEKFGKCDILINGAGGNNPKATTSIETHIKNAKENDITFYELSKEGFEFVFNLNFMGTFLPSQIFSKDMIDKEGCSIVNMSSMNAYRPLTKIPAYSAAKAGISNFTQWLAVYLADSKVRVNAIAPGFFSTNQTKSLFFNPDGTPSERNKKIITNTPMGRFGEPYELLGTLFWLLSNEASGFVTGTIIPVDGGFSAYSGV